MAGSTSRAPNLNRVGVEDGFLTIVEYFFFGHYQVVERLMAKMDQ
jgi:hypothetical protein